jgi:glycosyltransferase involved in cell wall biosynthesis
MRMHDVTSNQRFPAEAPDSGESRTRRQDRPEPAVPDPDMRVSVVVPTFNASARLKATIRSVLAQTLPPHEIIIVDDGSTDDTKQVCAAFGDAVIVIPVPNGGQQRARNLGVERATGEWISFLDHDDLWDPEYLAEVAEFQRGHAVDLIFCDSRTVLEDGTNHEIKDGTRFTALAPPGYWPGMGVDPADRWSVLERYGYAQYLAFHPAQPSVTTIRKDFFQRTGGYDERMRGSSAENFEFEVRALRSARVGLIWRPLVSITRHGGNASADGSKMAMDLVDCLRFVQLNHDLAPAERVTVEAELQRRLRNAMNGAFTLRRFGALREYRAMLTSAPDTKMRIKCGLARLPRGVAGLCADLIERRAGL